jgi:hypothetical protein
VTIEQLINIVTAGGPSAVLALWLWSERKERLRLQRVLESFLPLLAGTQRAMRSVNRVVSGDTSDDG